MIETPQIFPFELDSVVGAACNRRGHRVWKHWEVVERFFYEETVDAVAVEDEVAAVGVLISYHATGPTV